MSNPLYDTATYMGSFDDMVSLFPPDDKHLDSTFKFSSILCEQLLFSGPMLVNDGYFVQQPEFLRLCEERPRYLDAAIEYGMLKIVSRGGSLNEVIENAAVSGVRGHKIYKNGEYKKYKKSIEKLSHYFHDKNAVISFPKKDLTSGYLKLVEQVANNLDKEGSTYPHRESILPIIEEVIERIKSEGKAARTQWEEVSTSYLNHGFRSEQALKDPLNCASMHLANEIYHHNLTLLLSNSQNTQIFCDTNRSGIFDNFMDSGYLTNKKFKNTFIPYVRKEWVLKDPDNLAGLFDEDNCLYSIKRDYLKELHHYMTTQNTDPRNLLEMKKIYQYALGMKMRYGDNLSRISNRIDLTWSLSSAVGAALVGAAVAPQIGASMIVATLALTAANFVAGHYIVPRAMNLYLCSSADRGSSFGEKMYKKAFTRNASFINLPICKHSADEFAEDIPDFS